MTKEGEKIEKQQKLSREILEMLGISFVVGLFIFGFLYYTSLSIGETYLYKRGIVLGEIQEITFCIWTRSICLTAAIVVFLAIFLFILGQKIAYLLYIVKGVETLQQKSMDFIIPLEGNDELTELARSINDLSKSQREIQQKEKEMQEEKEQLIRSLSHDIRTPLTSLIAYSEYMGQKEQCSLEEMKNYMELVQAKSEQIKILTDQLLGKKESNREYIENGKLLMEQFVSEWEEWIEDEFCCEVHLEHCKPFHAKMEISDLHRIFDNLASNVKKYAEKEHKVEMFIEHQDKELVIIQRNQVSSKDRAFIESHKIGIGSIEQIAKKYNGTVIVTEEDGVFEIQISLGGIIIV